MNVKSATIISANGPYNSADSLIFSIFPSFTGHSTSTLKYYNLTYNFQIISSICCFYRIIFLCFSLARSLARLFAFVDLIWALIGSANTVQTQRSSNKDYYELFLAQHFWIIIVTCTLYVHAHDTIIRKWKRKQKWKREREKNEHQYLIS